MARLGLARRPGDALHEVVAEAGWEPVACAFTQTVPTQSPNPFPEARLAVVLSPAGAREVHLPAGLPCLATGEATAEVLRAAGHPAVVPATPDAEGLWDLLRSLLPEGGDVLVVRGQRTRGYLDQVTAGGPWRLHAWITHEEVAADPFPDLDGLDAVLALSPLQAELLAERAGGIPTLAWGKRTRDAFQQAGKPARGWCEPRPEALAELLRTPLA